jgi:hypothetical protein
MITLRFVRSDDVETSRAGPFPWARAADGVLQAGPDGKAVAHYQGGIWSVGRQGATRCIVQSEYGDVELLAKDQATSHSVARSAAIEFVDGSIYAHPKRRLLATLQEREHRWLADGKTWPAVMVELAKEFD